jgi:HNH endonuclease
VFEVAIDEDLKKVFRSYKRTASRLRDLVVESGAEDLALTFELRAEQDKTARARFTSGSHVARLAALLRPFMVKGSVIELRALWQRLLATGEVETETRTAVEQAFAHAERLSLHMKLNDRELSAREVYFAYGEGHYFAENGEARGRLAELSMGPMQALLPMLFHDACTNYCDLVFVVLEAILEVEKAHPEAFVESNDDGHQCIYCGKSEGDFNAEEHVIPESLAGDEIVLKGSVCSTCNNVLSRLDQVLLDFEPLAMLRTIHGPMTKKGKFQRARLSGFRYGEGRAARDSGDLQEGHARAQAA